MRYVLPILLLFTTPAFAGDYDGKWSYELATTSAIPTCQGFRSGDIEIIDGRFSGHIAHNRDSFRLKGEIDGAGKSEFKAIGAFDTALFTVHFTPDAGKGTWQANNLGCSGTITLVR